MKYLLLLVVQNSSFSLFCQQQDTIYAGDTTGMFFMDLEPDLVIKPSIRSYLNISFDLSMQRF